VRSASSEIRAPSKPKSALRTRSSSGSTQRLGSDRAPCIAPNAEPAVAPLQSVSQPPWTASPTVRVKSPSPHSSAPATTAALLIVWTGLSVP